LATHFHRLKIRDIRKETADCVSIAFEVPAEYSEEFRFIQGQNITVRIYDEAEEIRRSYSICSSPLDGELRIAVKMIEKGRFSAYAYKLRSGDELEILPPTGNFFTALNPVLKKNYVAFVAGSGITPVISIIKTTLASEQDSTFTLIYGNKNRHSIIFREELEGLKNRYMNRFSLYHVLSQEETDAGINHGRIDPEKCESFQGLTGLLGADDFFICGPESMIYAVRGWLESRGIEKKKIHYELFTIPGETVKTGEVSVIKTGTANSGHTSHVTIRQDGISFQFDLPFEGESILNAATQRGVDLPFSCKGGVCSTCRAMLVEGQVEMVHNYALEQDELDRGFILTCQSHPRSEKLFIDFDLK
jgi:ring-1,2-phenylacetyl-CoA epoxidase subunit PaaE